MGGQLGAAQAAQARGLGVQERALGMPPTLDIVDDGRVETEDEQADADDDADDGPGHGSVAQLASEHNHPGHEAVGGVAPRVQLLQSARGARGDAELGSHGGRE